MARVTEKPVVVTGAAGFIASHIVKLLLDKGYEVRGTVRDPSDEKKNAHLLKLEGAKERLKLYKAELLNEGVFDEVIEGTEIVLHTASPYILNVKDPQKDLIEPALKGTRNVLSSCKKHKVKKVVLTSSVAAISDSPKHGYIYTEKDWNEESSLDRNPYYYSKTLAEKEAWKIYEEQKSEPDKFELVTINPFAVIGPSLSESVNTSVEILERIFTKKFPAIVDLAWGFVDVRDVAEAHVLAMEKDVHGRFILWADTIHMRELVPLLQRKYPQFHYPSMHMDGSIGSAFVKLGAYVLEEKGTRQWLHTNLGTFPRLDHSKAENELGLKFRSLETTLYDTVDDLIAHNHITPAKH